MHPIFCLLSNTEHILQILWDMETDLSLGAEEEGAGEWAFPLD